MAQFDPQMKFVSKTGTSSSVLVAFERGMDPYRAAAGAVAELIDLVDDEQTFAHYAGALQMMFIGLEHRPPETVLEVRQFLGAIHAQWPWWVHFLAPKPTQWRTLLFALAGFHATPDGLVTDLRQVRRLVLDMLHANRVLCSHFDRHPSASRVTALTTWTAIKRGAHG
ncbi:MULTISPECIES: hypothetical protein [Ramlibacter]|uniref:Uncharacterized protein n=1 Tax=Ramlibacter aquaticus TaxID=2780094 RepID=A0ABR9SJ27_9BURK|nr:MULTISPECIES: hypothetical protein [Ramlibacter]MBE7942369.1 hypothetical protein [Ramlibacter aquaticus]